MPSTIDYEFKFYTPFGEGIFSLTSNYYNIQFWVSEKEVGSLIIDIPHNIASEIIGMLEYDTVVEIYRSRYGMKTLLFGKRWLLGQWRDKSDENGNKYMRLKLVCCNNIATRRIVAYLPETSYAKVESEKADDAIKRIMRENFGVSATDGSRNISNILEIEPNAGLASTVSTEDFARVNVFTVINNICDAAFSQNGEYLTFDIKWSPEKNKYVFQTYFGQLGVDRGINSTNTLYFTIVNDSLTGFGGLDYASIDIDGYNRRTFVYCGGQGEGAERNIVTAKDDNLIRLSPMGRWEDWQDARNTSDANLQAACNTRLMEWQPKVVINGHMSGSFTRKFGSELDWGDIVAFKFKNNAYDVHLDKVMFNLPDDSSELITIFTRNMKEEYY